MRFFTTHRKFVAMVFVVVLFVSLLEFAGGFAQGFASTAVSAEMPVPSPAALMGHSGSGAGGALGGN